MKHLLFLFTAAWLLSGCAVSVTQTRLGRLEADEAQQTPYFLSKRLVLKHRNPQTRHKERIVLRRRLPGEVVAFTKDGMSVRFHPRGKAPIVLSFGHYEGEDDDLYLYFDNKCTRHRSAIFKLFTYIDYDYTIRYRDKEWQARYRDDYSLLEDLLFADDEYTGEGDGKNDIPPHLVFR